MSLVSCSSELLFKRPLPRIECSRRRLLLVFDANHWNRPRPLCDFQGFGENHCNRLTRVGDLRGAKGTTGIRNRTTPL